MVNPEIGRNTAKPHWVKISITFAVVFGLLFVLHIAFGGGMPGLHLLHTGG